MIGFLACSFLEHHCLLFTFKASSGWKRQHVLLGLKLSVYVAVDINKSTRQVACLELVFSLVSPPEFCALGAWQTFCVNGAI